MPTPNDGSNGNKRPADDTDPEIAVLPAFLENGFLAWVQRIPGDYLARRVAGISLRCQKQGKHIHTYPPSRRGWPQSSTMPFKRIGSWTWS